MFPFDDGIMHVDIDCRDNSMQHPIVIDGNVVSATMPLAIPNIHHNYEQLFITILAIVYR